jgi:hypothetical protein
MTTIHLFELGIHLFELGFRQDSNDGQGLRPWTLAGHPRYFDLTRKMSVSIISVGYIVTVPV